jgi:uncharacterized RDD family membrane protein YckC
MNSRFKPDDESTAVSRSVDSESFDAGEPQFVATSDAARVRADQRFVVEASPAAESLPIEAQAGDLENSSVPSPQVQALSGLADSRERGAEVQPDLILEQDAGSWRREVAAKVNRYKARKPRPPRYPSLQLKFEPRESWKDPVRNERPELSDSKDYSAPSWPAVALQPLCAALQAVPHEEAQTFVCASALQTFETSGRILEFPRAVVLPTALDELAEPVSDRPRILEVAEQAPPAPALGGISMEPIEPSAEEKRRPGIEIPLQGARLSRRLWAASIDGVLIALASALFGYVFFRITTVVPPWREGIESGLVFIGLFWGAYQYLLLVHAGTTPGLKLAKLQLHRFDGTSVPLKTRRWRVLASFLSALSLGIGYAWCFLDEDRLCWHDRITHTYMAPGGPRQRI